MKGHHGIQVILYFILFKFSFKNLDLAIVDEPLPKILYPDLPYVWFFPVNKSEMPAADTYMCPVYITSKRAGELLTSGQSLNFIISIRKLFFIFLSIYFFILDLPFDGKKYNKEHWVKRGTAILCSLNE